MRSASPGEPQSNYLTSLSDWEVIGLSRRSPEFQTSAKYIAVDLLDRPALEERLRGGPDIQATSSSRLSNPPTNFFDQVAPNLAMLANTVEVVERFSPSLRKVLLVEGAKFYGATLAPTKLPPRRLIRGICRQISITIRRTIWSSARSARFGRGRRFCRRHLRLCRGQPYEYRDSHRGVCQPLSRAGIATEVPGVNRDLLRCRMFLPCAIVHSYDPLMPTNPASNQAVELDATASANNGTSPNRVKPKKWQASGKPASGRGGQKRQPLLGFANLPSSERFRQASPHYSMKVQFRGRRMAFTLGTGNKDAAARRAAGIYTDLLTLGVEATLARHRAQSRGEIPSKVATIGEWIEAARGVSASNATSFAQYAASLRLIAGQILSVKKTKKRFGPGKGGARAYRAGIDAQSLEILSEQAVQRWRLAYVAQAGNPAQERSRMTSANSTIRQARSLFANKIVRFLPDTRLPSPPPV